MDETDEGEVSCERVDEEAEDVLDLFDLFDERRMMKRGILPKRRALGFGGARGVSADNVFDFYAVLARKRCAASRSTDRRRRRVVYVCTECRDETEWRVWLLFFSSSRRSFYISHTFSAATPSRTTVRDPGTSLPHTVALHPRPLPLSSA